MRFHHLVLVLVTILAAACHIPPHAGEKGYQCGRDCNPGLECVDGICVACGGANEVCCDSPGIPKCDAPLACNGGQIGVLGHCTGDCGAIGLACCPDSGCPASGTCVDGQCQDPGGDPLCQGGPEYHVVSIIGPDCANNPKEFHTNSAADAETCRQALVNAAGPDTQVCDLDQKPVETVVCFHDPDVPPDSSIYFWHCKEGDAQLAICEQQYVCPNQCTWTDGACVP